MVLRLSFSPTPAVGAPPDEASHDTPGNALEAIVQGRDDLIESAAQTVDDVLRAGDARLRALSREWAASGTGRPPPEWPTPAQLARRTAGTLLGVASGGLIQFCDRVIAGNARLLYDAAQVTSAIEWAGHADANRHRVHQRIADVYRLALAAAPPVAWQDDRAQEAARTAVIDAVVGPIRSDWQAGERARAVGRVLFDGVMLRALALGLLRTAAPMAPSRRTGSAEAGARTSSVPPEAAPKKPPSKHDNASALRPAEGAGPAQPLGEMGESLDAWRRKQGIEPDPLPEVVAKREDFHSVRARIAEVEHQLAEDRAALQAATLEAEYGQGHGMADGEASGGVGTDTLRRLIAAQEEELLLLQGKLPPAQAFGPSWQPWDPQGHARNLEETAQALERYRRTGDVHGEAIPPETPATVGEDLRLAIDELDAAIASDRLLAAFDAGAAAEDLQRLAGAHPKALSWAITRQEALLQHLETMRAPPHLIDAARARLGELNVMRPPPAPGR